MQVRKNRIQLVRRCGVLAVSTITALIVGAASASAAPGDGSAYGANVNVTLVGQPAVTAGPFAAASTAGPTTNSTASVGVTGILTTGAINTSATLDPATGTVTSNANTANITLPLLSAFGTPTIGAASATCTATQTGITGTTSLTNANLGTIGTVGSNPAPNTVLTVKTPVGVNVATITFNEQITNPDGSLTVNAVHIHLLGGTGVGALGTGDVIISSATCGPAALPVPMASGAGLWTGLGLLAVVGLPVGAVLIRRRMGSAAA